MVGRWPPNSHPPGTWEWPCLEQGLCSHRSGEVVLDQGGPCKECRQRQKWREAATSQGTPSPREPQEAGGPSPRAPRGGVALPTWIFDFWLQNWERIHFCWFRPPILWHLVTAAPGHSHSQPRPQTEGQILIYCCSRIPIYGDLVPGTQAPQGKSPWRQQERRSPEQRRSESPGSRASVLTGTSARLPHFPKQTKHRRVMRQRAGQAGEPSGARMHPPSAGQPPGPTEMNSHQTTLPRSNWCPGH